MTEALERLLTIAQTDTGQGKIVANFILAWWNATEFGGFDLADLTNVDRSIREDMLEIIGYLASLSAVEYPTAYRGAIEKIVRMWRVAA
jgi:hypothetical protein